MSGECEECSEHTLECYCSISGKMEWIDINQEYPACGGSYLVTDGEDIQIMEYFGKYKESHDWSSKMCCSIDVTHWMPLQQLPKEYLSHKSWWRVWLFIFLPKISNTKQNKHPQNCDENSSKYFQ